MVEEVDLCVGKVLDSLDSLGIADNTLLVFFSDNGGDMYDRPDGVLPTSNAPLRGGKANLFEGGTREPLVVVWPGQAPAGKRSDAFVSAVDFYPTFLETAGIPLPEGHVVDGVSQVPVLCGEAESVREEVFCFFPHYTPATGQLPGASLRIGDWKLIRYFHDNPDQTHRYELFNLAEDLSETRNLADQHPERVKKMDARIEAILTETRATVPVKNEAYDPEANPMASGWQNGVVVRKKANPESQEKDGFHFDATSFGPAFTVEDIPASSGELTCTVTLQNAVDGCGQVSWVEEGSAMPRSAFFSYPGNPTMQTVTCRLPCTGAIQSLRLEPSRLPGVMTLGTVKLETSGGAVVREWNFAKDWH